MRRESGLQAMLFGRVGQSGHAREMFCQLDKGRRDRRREAVFPAITYDRGELTSEDWDAFHAIANLTEEQKHMLRQYWDRENKRRREQAIKDRAKVAAESKRRTIQRREEHQRGTQRKLAEKRLKLEKAERRVIQREYVNLMKGIQRDVHKDDMVIAVKFMQWLHRHDGQFSPITYRPPAPGNTFTFDGNRYGPPGDRWHE